MVELFPVPAGVWMIAGVQTLIAALAAWAVTWGLLKSGYRTGVPDVPGSAARGHPTGGGLAIGIVWLASLWGLGAAGLMNSDAYGMSPGLIAVALFAALMGVIGVVDDLYNPSALLRFGVQIALVAALVSLVRVEMLPAPGPWGVYLGPLVGAVGSAAWCLVVINAVNFMDGADGTASGPVAVALAGLGGLCLLFGQADIGIAALVLAGATVGFLYWNWGRGLIFMGNVGALALGAAYAGLALLAVQRGEANGTGPGPYTVALLLLPLLADVLLTLFWRARHKRNLLKGHREHLYQLSLAGGLSGGRVAGLMVVGSVNLALVALAAELFGPGWALLPLLVLAGVAVWHDARRRKVALEAGLLRE
jgi:UDP-GlcNAc:undecaprenyl-phosphate GlcNAc-1-phosphate transferase